MNKKGLKKCIILIILTSYYTTCAGNYLCFGLLMVIRVKFELSTMKWGLLKLFFKHEFFRHFSCFNMMPENATPLRCNGYR